MNSASPSVTVICVNETSAAMSRCLRRLSVKNVALQNLQVIYEWPFDKSYEASMRPYLSYHRCWYLWSSWRLLLWRTSLLRNQSHFIIFISHVVLDSTPLFSPSYCVTLESTMTRMVSSVSSAVAFVVSMVILPVVGSNLN